MEPQPKPNSAYYKQYIGIVGSDRHQFEPPPQKVLKQYRIELINQYALSRRKKKFDLRFIFAGKNASTASYIVDLGRFRLTINLLNLQGSTPIEKNKEVTLGSGAFGTVLVKKVANTEFVAKVIQRKDKTPSELEEIIKEVAISKLCAMHEIAPGFETSIPYDIIVYDNAVQFHLEKCQGICRIGSNLVNNEIHEIQLQNDLIHCVKVLHYLHIAHKDIKPSNTLYCRRLDRFVLCDFGCAEYIEEDIGMTSSTNFAGSEFFMGPEMKRLRSNPGQKVDLFYNDAYACERLLSSERGFAERRLANVNSSEYFSDRSKSQENGQSSVPHHEPDEEAFSRNDSYEFYRMVYAATAINEHDLNLQENFKELTEQQQTYIYNILLESLNQTKMKQVLIELGAMSPQEGTLKRWKEDFATSYKKNFDNHLPTLAQVHPLSKEWVNNLVRLLGKTPVLAQLSQIVLSEEDVHLLNQNSHLTQQLYECIFNEINSNKIKRLADCCCRMMTAHGKYLGTLGLGKQEIETVLGHMISFFTHDTRDFLCEDLLQSCERSTETDQLFLHCLASILRKERQAGNLLVKFTESKQPLERCIMLNNLHNQLSRDRHPSILVICAKLLNRLEKLPIESCWMEMVNVERIQFLVRVSRLEVNHYGVQVYFEKCLRMLTQYGSHQDSSSILRILGERLEYFQQFQFALERRRVAHVEFERSRQFYSGILRLSADMLVMNMYKDEKIQAPPSVIAKYTQLDVQTCQLLDQRRHLLDKGSLRQAVEVQQRIQEVGAEDIAHRQAILKANMLAILGKYEEAYQRLLSTTDFVCSSFNIQLHRDYYAVKAIVCNRLGRFLEALDSCTKAIHLLNKLHTDSVQNLYVMRDLQAGIYAQLHRYEESLELLSELRKELENDDKNNFQDLAGNYAATANVYRSMGKLGESTRFCGKVFQLEQRGLIYPHQSAFAHSRMALIYKAQGQFNRQLQECWTFLDKTNVLGDECCCMMYTMILRSCEQTVGNEALSFISYTRKFTDPPRSSFRGDEISEQLYENPVPTGLLPLDMPTSEFVQVAESRLRTLTNNQQLYCFIFKAQLLSIMPGKFSGYPQFRLIYVRTLVEILLHLFIARECVGFPEVPYNTIGLMRQCQVPDDDRGAKRLLVRFVQGILEREQSFQEELARNKDATRRKKPECPESFQKKFKAKRVH